MKTHLTYKILLLAAVFSLAFVFTACSADTATDSDTVVLPEQTDEETVSDEPAAEDTSDTLESESADEATEEETAADAVTSEETTEEDTAEEDTLPVFTLEELAQYDGQDGNAAYVAVDGVVYDVTDVKLWSGGTHNGNTAGQDLSEAILESPHGKAKLEQLTVVGYLAEE